MCHLSALKYTHSDVLSESSLAADGDMCQETETKKVQRVNSFNENSTTTESSDSSFDMEGVIRDQTVLTSTNSVCDQLSDSLQINGHRPRLMAF